MLDQRSLFDEGAPPADFTSAASGSAKPDQFHNLFFALEPMPEMALSITRNFVEWDHQYGIGGRLREANLLHVSLQAIGIYKGGVPLERVQFAKRIGDAVAAQAFELVLNRAMSFKGKKAPYVLRVGKGLEQVKALWRELGIAIANAGGPSDETAFTPHMTLSYGGHIVPEHPIDPIPWAVKDFVLIDSYVGKSHYEILGRWPLRD